MGMSEIKMTYTRQELIDLCELAIVPEGEWLDRDSCKAQQNLGVAWVLLKAGVEYEIDKDTDEETIWLTLKPNGFWSFDIGGEDGRSMDEIYLYLPTRAKVATAKGRGSSSDWYR